MFYKGKGGETIAANTLEEVEQDALGLLRTWMPTYFLVYMCVYLCVCVCVCMCVCVCVCVCVYV